ncbi:cell division protein ZapA [Modicisalibacter xianhensis]|uniref:Cell division protein ZapA n=1 Tax=Modicisalibacter xianhensis TaxID=442341 RepID=A0A1I3B9S5_9GAMM|nr:cell division protein ZapA [Halomonas xianhensis]SFH59043.1 cell division protein ZapA [Halomonas xianhensis]
MSDDKRSTTEITLLGRNYVIACPPEERPQLERAARYLDRAMHGIHSRGKVLDSEKVAIMAALNIAHELIRSQDEHRADEENLARLNERLGQALIGLPGSREATS